MKPEKKTTPKKLKKFEGTVIKEFKYKGELFKVGDIFNARNKRSLAVFINSKRLKK